MPNPKIVVYFKPMCGWTAGVLETLEKYTLMYESKNVLKDPEAYSEMVSKTRQTSTPCVEINGEMLADVGGEEVEAYLLEKGIVSPVDSPENSPISPKQCGLSE